MKQVPWFLTPPPSFWPIGGDGHMKFPPQTKKRPPQSSPPRLGGNRGSPPLAQIWRGSPCIFGGGTTYFLRPPQVWGGMQSWESATFPPNATSFGGDAILFPLQTRKPAKNIVWGGTRPNVSPPKHLNIPPNWGGCPPQSSPPPFWKRTVLLEIFFRCPPQ